MYLLRGLVMIRLRGEAAGVTKELVYNSVMLLIRALQRLISEALNLIDSQGVSLSQLFSCIIDPCLYLIQVSLDVSIDASSRQTDKVLRALSSHLS